MITIREYNPITDYPSIKSLYENQTTFGGQFDKARDSEDRLLNLIQKKSNSILVAEKDGQLVGTVTLFEDGRSAWLYRFAVIKEDEQEIAQELWEKASVIMKTWGHTQVLVYSPKGNMHFEERYTKIGFTKGNDFTAYWRDI